MGIIDKGSYIENTLQFLLVFPFIKTYSTLVIMLYKMYLYNFAQ